MRNAGKKGGKTKPPDGDAGGGRTGRAGERGLEVVNVAEGDAIAFGAVFGVHFEVEVGEEVVVGGEAPKGAGTDGENLFLAAGEIIAVDFAFGDLTEGVAVDTEAEMLGDDFVFGGEVGVDGLPGLSVLDGGIG